MRILVTGANGFMGTHLVAYLRAQGHEVREASRRANPNDPTAVFVADYRDPVSSARAVRNMDAVVHLAARVHILRENASDSLAAFRAVNVDGTRQLAVAARDAGVRHFLFASSLHVVGTTSVVPWTEGDAAHPVTAYGISKHEAELVLRTLARPSFAVTALRIPLTYGAGVGANMLRFLRLVHRGVPLPFGSIENARSYIGIGNLVRAMEIALLAGPRADGTFFVNDRRDLATRDLARLAGEALGRPARLVSVPAGLLVAAGRCGDIINRLRPFPLRSETLRQLIGNLQASSDRFRDVTGFVPTIRVEDSLAEAAAGILRMNTPPYSPGS
jgi:nucleoside-diphosphate-sugar epimerase